VKNNDQSGAKSGDHTHTMASAAIPGTGSLENGATDCQKVSVATTR